MYQEDNDKYIEVPVTPESTCNDVIACVQEPGDQSCSIIQKWKEHGNSIILSHRIKFKLRSKTSTLISGIEYKHM